MELTFENLLAHINTVYILVTKNAQTDKTLPSLATWHHDDDDNVIQEADLRLKVSTISQMKHLNRKPFTKETFYTIG